ncbi:D-aminoacyl-tRNA deacylase [uncultured Methanobrevibacter sp.]|uniref:D-aminoacyl-tRNA deacylase n=1 Tax=uncultured Methanobrevibacter sp. TaxID=253161 RepID=UPI0025DF6D1B|nr:D-aminoacyl-tRNA deacylase [uncultured Methanobrevibacter sp.]
MKLVVQRVKSASVEVDGKIIGEINKGYMVLVGFSSKDTEKEVDYMANKLVKLRIFEDETGNMNLPVNDVEGEVLLVPQFTLYGDTHKHNRPSFHKAKKSDEASKLFDDFVLKCRKTMNVQTGQFGAYMQVELVNDGPVTILIEKESDN